MNRSASAADAPPYLPAVYVAPPGMWVAFVAGCLALGVVFQSALARLAEVWLQQDEFSYGPLLPFICVFLVWQQKETIRVSPFTGSWGGFALFLAAALMALVGQLATVPTLVQYGLVLACAGLTLAATGWTVFRRLIAPFIVLILAIPLPGFFVNNLSSQMQLISSQLGVAVVRMAGISVFVEGNVIDLGSYRLQVAEACDGLRYLFPLMTIGFLMAYFFKVAIWKRVVLFVSSVPLTILMNSFRIGTIGIMVEHWGTRMAEGFLHEFQGWAVFMVSAATLLLEMMLLARIGRDARPWREVFGLEFPGPSPRDVNRTVRAVPAPFIASTVALAIFATTVLAVPQRADAIPQRESLTSFPNQFGSWSGRRSPIEAVYLDALKLDDYIMADFVREQREPVNFYVAWYDSQRAGQSAHSPRSCLPGGGWRITALDQIEVPGTHVAGLPLRANRAQIELGNQKQLVYYWFQQRGRVITNEYLVKWYLFWDALVRQRTDGALVRLVTPLKAGESYAAGDARLTQFAADVAPRLDRYIPD
jgi:exosortase D (VPLPA-CTERM-specific)